jgi:uroporphyrinogen-III decarboxylase
VVSNGDSWASPELVSPRIYRTFAAPYEARLAARARHLGRPYIIHICGKTDSILEDIAATGADGVELDYKTDVRRARATLDGRAAFLGNIDPSGVLALGSPALVEEKTRELLRLFDGCPGLILNAGCAVPATTPPANIHALVETARGFRGEDAWLKRP